MWDWILYGAIAFAVLLLLAHLSGIEKALKESNKIQHNIMLALDALAYEEEENKPKS